MRLLIAGQSYRPPANGEAVFSIQLAEGLARAGHEVMVLAPSNHLWPDHALENGVQVRGLFALPLTLRYPQVYVTPLPAIGAGRLLDQFQPQVVHIQDHYPLCRGVLVAARRRGMPLLGSNYFLPGNMIPHLPGFLRRRRNWAERVLWQMVLDVLNQVQVVTTPTETAAVILRQRGVQVPVRAISCGVDLNRFRPDLSIDRAALRRRYGLNPQRTLYLYVGRVDRDKGLNVLLRALYLVGRDDLELGIAGRGGHVGALQRLAKQLTLERQVTFTGYVPDEDLPLLLNSADIFVMPSEVELQSIATLEAMGTGRPILAAGAQALPELVQDGVNGYLFEAGNAQDAARCMARLADHPDDWAAMGAASLDLVRPHQLENTLRRYEELYRAPSEWRPSEHIPIDEG
jgi:1,2-diacylglycerol 3-alpha-glucosyltransferase